MQQRANPADALGMVDPRDVRGVPVSGGIPPLVRVAAGIGIFLVFVVAGMVIAVSGYGHVWPAADTAKIPLSP